MCEPDSKANAEHTSSRRWVHATCIVSFVLVFSCCCIGLFCTLGEHAAYVVIVGWMAGLTGSIMVCYLETRQESREDWLAYWLGTFAAWLPIQLLFGAFFGMFGSHSMILFLIALQTWKVVQSYRHWKAGHDVDYREVERGDLYSQIVQVAGFAMSVVVVALFFRDPLENNFPNGPLTAASIGIQGDRSAFECLSAGVMVMVAYLLARMSVIPWIERSWSNDAQNWARTLVFFRMATPRGRLAICLCRTLTVLTAILEEVLFRGIFVFHLGEVTGSRTFAIALGLVLFLAVHTYQGPAMILKGVVFYACVVGLLYSRFGLLGAIGMHVAWNYYFVSGLPKNAATYRRYLDAARQA